MVVVVVVMMMMMMMMDEDDEDDDDDMAPLQAVAYHMLLRTVVVMTYTAQEVINYLL